MVQAGVLGALGEREVLDACRHQGGLPGGVLCPKVWSLVFPLGSSVLQMLAAQTTAGSQQVGRYPRKCPRSPTWAFQSW